MTHDIIKLMYERDHVHATATHKLWQEFPTTFFFFLGGGYAECMNIIEIDILSLLEHTRNYILRNIVTGMLKERQNVYFNDIHTLCIPPPPPPPQKKKKKCGGK